jgi:hypothetical protein
MMEAGRAYTPEAKRQLIDRLLDVWLTNADLRLGQLIASVLRDPFYAEDAFLIREIELYYAHPEQELKGWL